MIKIAIDILNGDDWDIFDLEIEPFKNNPTSPLKSYSYYLYHVDNDNPILEGEVHYHDENAGPFQLVRRVINAIKI